MKTLGIKFQVAGAKEAEASLNSLRSGTDSALNQNKKAIANYQRDVKRGWKEWKIENFGSISQKQNLVIRTEKREFKERSTYKQLHVNNRGLVLEFRLAYKDFFGRLEQLLGDNQNPSIFEKTLDFVGKPIGFAVDAILFPFQSALAGAFERMGEVQVQDFAEGFNKNLQRALGLSFEETGGDVGNIIGKSLYKVYQKSVDVVDDYVKGTLQFNLADTLIDAFKYTTKTLAKELPALALRTHRRIQINKKAIPEARRAAGMRMVENDLPEGTRKDIEENKSITLVYGGANTDSADIGKDYTARVMKPYLKGSAVIPMTRQWTNSAVDSEFQGDVRNLIKLVLSNQATAQTFKGFIAENGLSALGSAEQKELMEGLDLEGEIDLSSLDRIAELVESLMGNKDFALGKALQATFMGYNPDDVLGAAEAISLMEQFPDKDLQIGGFSHGGYNALGTVDLLNRMGYTNVKGFSIGTPITGANATVNPDNFKAFMGDKDYYYKALTGLAGDEIDFPEFFELGEREGNLHSLQGYVRGDSVKGGLQEFLGDRVDIPSKDEYGKHDSAYGYAVGELGAETSLIRTLLAYLGESQLGAVDARRGFVYSAEGTLPGYVNNIKELGRGLKNEDTKQFHAEYIDFLETLQEELEIAEKLSAIGQKYKPVKSLQKAAKIFPQMESLAAKHTSSGMSDVELEQAIAEADEKEKLVFFQRKIKQEKDNIERTFQAMLGRKFTKKDEKKGIYSFYNPDEYDERAGNFEGMVNWLENDVLGGASDEEKESAKPVLDLLHKITANIRSTGSTGQLDIETVRQAEKLLGVDLREFDLLFKELEGLGKTSVDVNQYFDELRTLRRNRDQILNEKKTPSKVVEAIDSARTKINSIDTEAQPVIESEDTLLLRRVLGRRVLGMNLHTQKPTHVNLHTQKPTLSLEQLQSAFSEYLQEIIRKGTEYGTDVLKENANQIQGSNFNEAEVARQFNELNEEFKKATKQYRDAVKSGNGKLATELAENLLFQSASLKRIYGELADSIQDENTAKSMRGFSGYLTAVQTEITSGQPNLRGRIETGLPEMVSNDKAIEAVVRKIDFGADIRAGVDSIVNRETGQEIGYQFVLGINEGGQDAADINSPSRVWQWIGNMIRAGFAAGVSGIGDYLSESVQGAADAAGEVLSSIPEAVSEVAAELDDSEGLLDTLLETEGVDEEVNNFFGELIQKVSKVFDDLKEKFPILGRIGDLLLDIGGEVLQVLGIFTFGETLINFSNEALAAAMQMESLEKSIVAVSRSASDGADNIRFIREEARRLSIDLVTAEESYKRILGATKNTPLEGLQTEQIFSTLATTAKNRGLNADATSRMFLGFEQAIAKGEFKSEEVRGQLAEVLGDIQNLLATSVGVPTSQLGELMEAGDLKVGEVMPKLIAQLNAQNSALGNTSGTAAAAQTRLNNAILEYQDSVGRQLQPVQKLGLNALASILEVLRKRAAEIAKLTTSLLITVLVNLTLKLLSTKLATFALGDAIYRLGFALGAMLPKLVMFITRFALITVEIEVWMNNIKLAKNAFPELEDRIEASTKRLDALRKAFDDTGDAAKNFGKNQPETLQLNEGLDISKMPGWIKAIAGGDRLNLDNLVRNRWNGVLDRLDAYNKAASGGTAKKIKGRITTQAQKKQADFVVGASDIIGNSDRTLTYGIKAKSVLDEIAKLDAVARDLQSQRLNILPGDSGGLKAALAKEQKVLEQRDELLTLSSQYTESLQGDIQDIKDTLLELDELDLTGGSDEEVNQRANTRASLEERLGLLEDEKKAIDEINSRIPKFLSEVDRLLRNSDERVQGYLGNSEDDAVGNRTEAIQNAIALGLSDAELEVTLDNLSATDLEDRIEFIQKEINSLEDKLGSAYLQEGVAGLERSAAEQGLELTPVTLERMREEGRSSQETKAANILLALDEYEGMVAQASSGLVDLIKNNRSKLIDFNKNISDYFSRITQQIKEAIIESERLISQIFYTDIKNRLRSAIAPGSNTFVNGIVDNIQSVLDEAQQLAEKAFGDTSAQLSLEMEVRSLAIEMNEFVRQVGTAGDALLEFVAKLNGGTLPERTSPMGRGSDERDPDEQDKGKDIPGDEKRSATDGRLADRKTTDPVSSYITNVLKQPAGVDTGVEQMLAIINNNREMSVAPEPEIINNPVAEAEDLNNELVDRKRLNLGLQRYTTTQQKSAFLTQADNIIETNKRQILEAQIENERSLMEVEGKFADLASQYDYASSTAELKLALFAVKTTFFDTNTDLDAKIRASLDAIKTIENLQQKIPADIARLRSFGTPEALKLAQVKQSGLNELQKTLPTLSANLTKMQSLASSSVEIEKQANNFTQRQGELKIEIESLQSESNVLGVKSNVIAARGTIEQKRQLDIEQEKYRLKLRIADIELNQRPSPERDRLIEAETKKSRVDRENINYQARLDEFDLEKRLLDYDSGIGDKNAGFLSRYGFNLQADKLRRNNAIATENNRFQKELVTIQFDFAGQSDQIELFTKKAKELNQVNLKAIEQQFKSLHTTIEDFGISAVQGFFTNFVTEGISFVDQSEKERQVLEERLRYAEELVSLENQYREEPGKISHLKNRARELNEEKLDKIRSEFNLFSRTVDLAKQAVMEFVKQLAVMAAQRAAAKFISSILGSAIGGAAGGSVSAVGNGYGSGAGIGAFVADKGITVGDDIKSRKKSDRNTSILRRSFPGIASSWNAEGEGAQLGVFHTGEELLSRKTGEARRYQMLKREYGINPLAKVLNYSEGGTIPDVGSNILSGFSNTRIPIDLGAINSRSRSGSTAQAGTTVYLSETIYTQDADSFRLNEDQRNQDLLEKLRRGI